MIKKLFLGSLFLTFQAFSHSANDQDLEGTWILVESKWNDQLISQCDPVSTKIYAQGIVMYTYYQNTEANACNKLSVGQATYSLTNGIVNETITNHSESNLIGEIFTYKPNFMFDKKSFVQEVKFGENVLFERWANIRCNEEKCARIN